MPEKVEWKPPFCANDADEVKCPKCGEGGCVRVREKETYFDGDCCEAYCAECHADLEVQVSVDVTFSDADVSDFDENLCYRCGGSGTIERRCVSDEPEENVEIDCPACGGSGDVVAPSGSP